MHILKYSGLSYVLPTLDSTSLSNNSLTHAVPTGISLFRLAPPPSSSKWRQVNYTRLERLLRCAIPRPDYFEGEFSSLCWHDTLDIKATPGIFSLMKDIVSANLTQERSRSVIASIQAETIERRLVCLPSVFMPGFPKCGSTSLFNTLVHHPLVEDTEMKETHFFTRFPFQNDDDIDYLSILTYLRNFDQLGNCSKTNHTCLSIDGSQSLLWDTRTSTFLDEVPLLVNHIFPRPKFIVILREPVKRFISDFWFFTIQCVGHSHRYWKKIGPKMLHKLITEELDKIRDCVQKGNEEEICIHHSLVGTPNLFDDGCGEIRVGVGAYYVHVARWLRTFPIHSFHFVRMEDLMAHPYAIMEEIWKFLNLPPVKEENFKMDIQPSNSISYPKLLPETKKALTDFYRPYNTMLSDLLKDDRYLWKDVAS